MEPVAARPGRELRGVSGLRPTPRVATAWSAPTSVSARSLARRFVGRGEPLDDLEQVAFEGLVKAVERFDPDRGSSFAAFAVPTIVGEIKRHFRDHTWATKVPRGAKELSTRITASTEALSKQLHRTPTVAELAEALGVSDDVVIEALEARAAYRPGSLSAPVEAARGDGRWAILCRSTIRDMPVLRPASPSRACWPPCLIGSGGSSSFAITRS